MGGTQLWILVLGIIQSLKIDRMAADRLAAMGDVSSGHFCICVGNLGVRAGGGVDFSDIDIRDPVTRTRKMVVWGNLDGAFIIQTQRDCLSGDGADCLVDPAR